MSGSLDGAVRSVVRSRKRAVPTTPTTVTSGPVASPNRNRRPSGSSPGQNRRAVAALTTATSCALSRSAAVNARPRTSGMPSVAK